ncbi:unnamed protein product [Lactuca virosa]|uniref:F-box domain-containing protein n=1 Tax=Lactuca virosa TaxID=75947 RepID=A0AAU9N4K0_9ASTR|nr:unnamed protein product [Lactuca virosa]
MESISTAEPWSAMKESPNWLQMPDEVMVNIFQRLHISEILNSARKVCTTWLKICKYPAMWKVINMVKRQGKDWGWGKALTMELVDLSCGELIDISIGSFGSDELLDHIVKRSRNLKRLCLVNCFRITGGELSLAVERLPKLEELRLSKTYINAKDLEVIGRICPQLKSFKMCKVLLSESFDNHALAIADNMHELRHLDVSDTKMTNDRLEAIVNGCPHLESLDVRMCYNLDLDGSLGKLCKKRIKDFKHSSTQNRPFYHQFSDSDDDQMYDDFSESDFFED